MSKKPLGTLLRKALVAGGVGAAVFVAIAPTFAWAGRAMSDGRLKKNVRPL